MENRLNKTPMRDREWAANATLGPHKELYFLEVLQYLLGEHPDHYDSPPIYRLDHEAPLAINHANPKAPDGK